MKQTSWSLYLNKQKYSECQLITALNAYCYLTGKQYCSQNSKKYEQLVDLCGARHGSTINISKVHKRLGLIITKTFKHKIEFPKTFPLPLEASVWHKKSGFHSVCIVGYEPRTQCIRVPNFFCVTSLEGWIFLEDWYQYSNDLHGWAFRQFSLA